MENSQSFPDDEINGGYLKLFVGGLNNLTIKFLLINLMKYN